MELISVIIPIYNAEKTLYRCIESVLKQTYSHLEIILVNDGSHDHSLSICQQFCDQRIHIINQENQGVSHARNSGIQKSQGTYICFVDSDDYLKKNHIEKMYNAISDNKCDLVITNFYEINSHGMQKNASVRSYCGENISDWFYNVYTNSLLNQPWNKLFKSEKIQEYFREDWSLGEDLIFNIDYLSHINKVCIINEFTYIYDIQMGGNLHKGKQSINEFFYLYQYMNKHLLNDISYHSWKYHLFILKHYIRFLFENQYSYNNEYYQFLDEFYKTHHQFSIFYSKPFYYILSFAYKQVKRRNVK